MIQMTIGADAVHPHANLAIIGDIVAGVAVLGSLAGYLPDIAAGMAILWYVMQFSMWLRKLLSDGD